MGAQWIFRGPCPPQTHLCFSSSLSPSIIFLLFLLTQKTILSQVTVFPSPLPVFHHCPFLVRDSVAKDLDKLIAQWKSHKYKKPARGAIILNKDLTKVQCPAVNWSIICNSLHTCSLISRPLPPSLFDCLQLDVLEQFLHSRELL